MGMCGFYVDVVGKEGCMAEATTTVQMDKRGRVVIPQAARDKLGIDDESATVEIVVRTDE
jgi:bifunctional DNA-binding transcriptional regulator/antitoxin component of YhaV-PrlF toxin-antitoxin module